MVRSRKEGWLQGFIITTTFTTWQRWFRWDSLAHCAGIVDRNGDRRAKTAHRVVDADGSLSNELNAQFHHGDPKVEGVVWPRVAEISLVGALGCGRWLVELIVEEMESKNEYDFIVLQAADNSIGFYERMGFVRVGAVAKYFQTDSKTGANLTRGGGRSGTATGRGKTRLWSTCQNLVT